MLFVPQVEVCKYLTGDVCTHIFFVWCALRGLLWHKHIIRLSLWQIALAGSFSGSGDLCTCNNGTTTFETMLTKNVSATTDYLPTSHLLQNTCTSNDSCSSTSGKGTKVFDNYLLRFHLWRYECWTWKWFVKCYFKPFIISRHECIKNANTM